MSGCGGKLMTCYMVIENDEDSLGLFLVCMGLLTTVGSRIFLKMTKTKCDLF